MSESLIDLGVFHRRMVAQISQFFGNDVAHVGAYERFRDVLPSPLVMVELDSVGDDSPDEVSTGQAAAELEFSAFVVVNGLDADAELRVRQLALRLRQFLFRNNFGMEVCFPKLGDARSAEFDWPKSLASAGEFVIWRVGFTFSDVFLGENCWEDCREDFL